MDTSTTTAPSADDDAILPDETEQVAQSESSANDVAATKPEEPQKEEAEAEPSQDDNLAWLSKKGIDPNSPEALAKVAEMYRNAERAMHESTVKASELEKTLSSNPPVIGNGTQPDVEVLAAEVQNLKLKTSVAQYWVDNPDKRAAEPAMADIVLSRPEIGELVKTGYLSLDDLYNLAISSDPTREEKLKQDGGREALQKVASKQQAKAVPGVATSSEFSAPKEDAFLKAFEQS